MKTNFERFLDERIAPSPLQKVQCNACGLMTKRRDMVSEFGVCAECYMQYAEDQRFIYGERSESEEYRLAN